MWTLSVMYVRREKKRKKERKKEKRKKRIERKERLRVARFSTGFTERESYATGVFYGA